MVRKIFTCVICAVLVLTMPACQSLAGRNPADLLPAPLVGAAQATAPAPTTDTVATIRVEAVAAETATAAAGEAQATAQAAEVAEADAKATQAAGALSATQTAAVKVTENSQQAQAASATAGKQATAQANFMFQRVKELETKGFVKNGRGSFYPVEDFNMDWAQLGWYQWWNTGYQPSDFVLYAHTAWESASKTADWSAAGCGFVFRARDENNHYIIYLALDGNVYLKGYVKGQFREIGKGYTRKIDHLKGEVDVMLIAQGERIIYFINGTKALDRTAKDLTQGDLGLTIVSGANQDFGTRCTITNIQLWDLTK